MTGSPDHFAGNSVVPSAQEGDYIPSNINHNINNLIIVITMIIRLITLIITLLTLTLTLTTLVIAVNNIHVNN